MADGQHPDLSLSRAHERGLDKAVWSKLTVETGSRACSTYWNPPEAEEKLIPLYYSTYFHNTLTQAP